MGPNLQHVSNTSPITSLAFHTAPDTDPLLLVGEGPFVKVLETSGSPLTKSHRIFARERIHGIALSPTAPQVLFWGGRSISITSITSLLALQCPPLREIAVSDWVFYACFLPSTHGGIPRVAVITAHNSLLLFSPYSGWTELAVGERCMLYSAHLLHLPSESNSGSEQDERILVAAGTVFGEILIWSTTLADTDEKGKATLHYRLLGHEGSIFGVNISPVYPGGKRYLASCSDDRTVRVWDISHLPSSAPSSEEKDGQTKNTGFNNTSETTPTPGGVCISLGWGHTARIWGVRFLPEPTANGEIKLLSISEDLTSKFWSFNPELTATPQLPEKTDTELQNTATYQLHSGKHLWSYALHIDAGLLATGGADGRVGLVEYNDPEGGQCEEWDMAAVLLSALGEEDDAAGPKDAFKAYTVLDSDRFLVTTSQGRLLTYNFSTKNWRLVAAVDSLKSWSVLASWKDEGMIALGNGSGQAGVCCINTGREWWWSAGGESAEVVKADKVGGVWTSAGVRRGDTPETKTYHMLTTSLVTSTFTLHAFNRFGEDIENRTTTILTPPLENGTKKFLVTSMCIDYTTSLIFLGSRNGAVAIYKLSGAFRGCWQGVHDADAVTSIVPLPLAAESRVLTAGRNGGYTILSFSDGAKTAMTILHAVKPTVCTVIEGATRARVLYGFRGKHFFVWDEQQACEVAAVECGGAHRAWAFYWPDAEQDQDQKEGWFVWTKASKIRVARTPLSRRRVLQQGLHGREIKALAYSSEMGVLATGAEDTVVRLSTVNKDTGEVASLAVVKRHTTGVQHLVWSACGRWLFSSGGVEEFFVWRVRKSDSGLGVVEEAKCEVGEEGGDLRICGFDVVGVHEEKTDEVIGFVIGMVYSDSSVKVYHYSLSTKTFTLLIAGAYKTCCLLHAHFVVLPATPPTAGRLLLLVAATDGFITAYELTDLLPDHQLSAAHSGHLTFTPLTPAQKKKNKKKKQQRKNSTAGGARALPQPALTTCVHQSGIKVLALVLSPSHITVFSGGDDCALAITRVPLTAKLGPAESFVLPRAHASAVAALVPLGDRVLSVGVDQAVSLWSVTEDERKVGLRLQDEAYTPVADVAGVVALGGGLVLVGGVGVDVWRVA